MKPARLLEGSFFLAVVFLVGGLWLPRVGHAQQYLGCFNDTGDRDLNGYSLFQYGSMTNEFCIATCGGGGFRYAGTQYGSYCFCGNKYGTYGATATLNQCNSPCSGNPHEICGGSWANSVFSTEHSSLRPPVLFSPAQGATVSGRVQLVWQQDGGRGYPEDFWLVLYYWDGAKWIQYYGAWATSPFTLNYPGWSGYIAWQVWAVDPMYKDSAASVLWWFHYQGG